MFRVAIYGVWCRINWTKRPSLPELLWLVLFFCKRPIQITLHNTPGNMLKGSPPSIRNKQRGRLGVMQHVLCIGRADGGKACFGVNQHGSEGRLTPHLRPWLTKALACTDGQWHPADSGFRGVGKMILRW